VPRSSEWIQQLPDALVELKGLASPVVDRAILEKVLRIHRRVAIRLMGKFGGFQVGKTFLIERAQLIARLEEIARGEDYARELDRRAQLADVLERSRRLAPGRQVRITAPADVRGRLLADLPAGIPCNPANSASNSATPRSYWEGSLNFPRQW
jgi:hypothetical protein